MDATFGQLTIDNQTVTCQWVSGHVVGLQEVASTSPVPITTLIPMGTITVPVTSFVPVTATVWQFSLMHADGSSTPMAFGFPLPLGEGQWVSAAYAYRVGDPSFWLVLVNHDTGQSSCLASPDEVLGQLRVARFAPFWLTGLLGAFGISWLALAIFWAVLDWAALGAVEWGALPFQIFVLVALLAGGGCLGCLAFNRWQRRRSKQTWTQLDVWVQAMVRSKYDGTAATQ